MQTDESWGHVNVLVNDAIQNDSRSGRALQRMTKNKTVDGEVKLGPEERHDEVAADAGIIVLASGNLGLVYGTTLEKRTTLEEVKDYFPGLLEGLAQHEGIGWVMMNSTEHGAVVVGEHGRLLSRRRSHRRGQSADRFWP